MLFPFRICPGTVPKNQNKIITTTNSVIYHNIISSENPRSILCLAFRCFSFHRHYLRLRLSSITILTFFDSVFFSFFLSFFLFLLHLSSVGVFIKFSVHSVLSNMYTEICIICIYIMFLAPCIHSSR